jgi:multidrug resistance efflux pump
MNSMGGDNTALMSIVSIVFLYAYTFMMSATCTRCYSMIYLLPDKVLTWIGAPAMASQEVQATMRTANKVLQKIGSTGQKAGEDAMKGATDLFQEQVGKGMKKYKADDYKKKTLSDFAQGADRYFKTDIFSKTHSRGADLFSNITTSKTTRDTQQTINSVSKGDFESKIADAQSTVATCEKAVQDAQTKTQQLEQEIAVANNDFKILPTAQKQINLDELNKDLLTSKATLATANNELKEVQLRTSLLQKTAESGIVLNKAILTSKKAELEKIPDATEREALAKNILKSVKETKELIQTYAMSINSDLESKIGNAQSKVATLKQEVEKAQKEIKNIGEKVAEVKGDSTLSAVEKTSDLTKLKQKLLISKASLATNNTQLKEAQSNTADLKQQAESERALNKVILKSKKAELEKITDTTERESRAKNILKSVKETEKLIDTYTMKINTDLKGFVQAELTDAIETETVLKQLKGLIEKDSKTEEDLAILRGIREHPGDYLLQEIHKQGSTIETAGIKEIDVLLNSIEEKKVRLDNISNIDYKKDILKSKKEELENILDPNQREARIKEILIEESSVPKYASSLTRISRDPFSASKFKAKVSSKQKQAVERVRDDLVMMRKQRVDGQLTTVREYGSYIGTEIKAAVLTRQIHGDSKTLNALASMTVGFVGIFNPLSGMTRMDSAYLFARNLLSLGLGIALFNDIKAKPIKADGTIEWTMEEKALIFMTQVFTSKNAMMLASYGNQKLNELPEAIDKKLKPYHDVFWDKEQWRELSTLAKFGYAGGVFLTVIPYGLNKGSKGIASLIAFTDEKTSSYLATRKANYAYLDAPENKTYSAKVAYAAGNAGRFIYNQGAPVIKGVGELIGGSLLIGLGAAGIGVGGGKLMARGASLMSGGAELLGQKLVVDVATIPITLGTLAVKGGTFVGSTLQSWDDQLAQGYSSDKRLINLGINLLRSFILPVRLKEAGQWLNDSEKNKNANLGGYIHYESFEYRDVYSSNLTRKDKAFNIAVNTGLYFLKTPVFVAKGAGQVMIGGLQIATGNIGISGGDTGISMMGRGVLNILSPIVTPIKTLHSIVDYGVTGVSHMYESTILPKQYYEFSDQINKSFEYRDVYSQPTLGKQAFNMAVNTGLYALKTPVFVAKGAVGLGVGATVTAVGLGGLILSGNDTMVNIGTRMMAKEALEIGKNTVAPPLTQVFYPIVDYGVTGAYHMYKSTTLPKQFYEFLDHINKSFEYRDVYSQPTLGKQAFNMAVNAGLYTLKAPVFVVKGAVVLGVGATVTAVGLGGLVLSGNDTIFNIGANIMAKEALEIGRNTVFSPSTPIFYPNYHEIIRRDSSADTDE